MRLEVWTLFLRLWELWGRGIGRKRLLGFHFRRLFCNGRSDLLLQNFWSRRDRLSFLYLLGKGQFDAGEIKRRKDIRMRCVFKIGDQRRGDKTVDQDG